jgi:murein DD-endopeptidase MepM/ murein hydrolase activator NlpD
LQSRNQETVEAEGRLSELHTLTEEFGRTANDLKTLMDRVAMLRSEGPASRGMTVVTPGRPGSGDIGRGSLRAPVAGKVSAGDPAGPGNTPGATGPSGLWFEGPGGARAVAPGDSEVVFAGPYQKFGQVLILEMMGGYHLTLAGLGRIDVRIGDQVLAGEPVGTLPDGRSAWLYLELRRNGQTVDPTPWMGAEVRKAKGT